MWKEEEMEGKNRMERDELEDFFNATLYGETGSFSAFVRRQDIDFNQTDEYGNTALHFAGKKKKKKKFILFFNY